MNGGKTLSCPPPLRPRLSWHRCLPWVGVTEGRTAEPNTFLHGIAHARHHSQVRKRPWARFFNGVNATKKQTAAPLGCFAAYAVLEFLSLQETVPPVGQFFGMSRSMRNSRLSFAQGG